MPRAAQKRRRVPCRMPRAAQKRCHVPCRMSPAAQGRRRVVSCLHALAPALTGAPRTGVGRVGAPGHHGADPRTAEKGADCSRFAARLRALGGRC
eukprot:gene9010-biopygen3964